MATLKIFRGNWDGTRERAVVAPTKKRAQELLGARTSHMNAQFSQGHTLVRAMDRVVWATPEVVFERKIDSGSDLAHTWSPVPLKT